MLGTKIKIASIFLVVTGEQPWLHLGVNTILTTKIKYLLSADSQFEGQYIDEYVHES
jgi:hypothetical protein